MVPILRQLVVWSTFIPTKEIVLFCGLLKDDLENRSCVLGFLLSNIATMPLLSHS